MKRLHHIDALRGFAAIGVAIFHLWNQNGGTALAALAADHRLLAIFVGIGRHGVEVFFALSGFVLTYTLWERDRIRRLSDIGRYFMRRSVRLDPVYWAILFAYILLWPALVALGSSSRYAALDLSAGEIVGNVLYFFPFLYDTKFVPVVWTLVVEVQFYVSFAFLLWAAYGLTRRLGFEADTAHGLMFSFFVVLGAPWALGLASWQEMSMLPHVSIFALGIAACLLVVKHRHRFIFAAFALAPVVAGQLMGTGSSRMKWGLISFVAFLLVSWVPILTRWLSTKPFRLLGRWSYATYLLHPLLGALIVEALQTYIGGPAWADALYVALGIVATLAASELVWHVVEQPAIAMSKRVRLADDRDEPAAETPEVHAAAASEALAAAEATAP